jgi:hypothetical protein
VRGKGGDSHREEAHAQDRRRRGLGLTAALGAGASAHGAAFTVNDRGDAGDGTCDTTPSDCTLRDALAAAAANDNEPRV